MTLSKTSILSITLIYFIILCVSAFKIVPRIYFTPEPSSDARFHHHNGDGNTELGVLNAHKNWKKFGYSSSTYLPQLSLIETFTTSAPAYTHYPALPYLFSSLLLSTFSSNERQAIQVSRLFIFLLTSLLAAISIFYFCKAFEESIFCASAMALFLALTNGFIIYADNLFLHGFNFSLQAVLLTTVIQKNPNIKIYFALSLVSIFTSVELIPCIFLAPILQRYLYPKAPFAKKLFLAASVAFIAGIITRFIHNAMYFQNFSTAWHDWFQITQTRLSGTSEKMDLTFWKTYFFEWLRYQRIMISKYGQIWMFIAALILLFKRQFLKLGFYFAFFMIAMFWNFIFIQHSLIHLFTTRYIIWPFLISILLIWPFFIDLSTKIRNCSK